MNESITKEVLTHHLTAFGNNNIEAILKDYTEESVVLTPDGLLKGLDMIRQFFEAYFIEIPTGAAFEMKQLLVTGNAAFIVWASKSVVAEIAMGTDTFFLEGDKIAIHSVASHKVNT
jgi:ketosteroid isomerase-like protein